MEALQFEPLDIPSALSEGYDTLYEILLDRKRKIDWKTIFKKVDRRNSPDAELMLDLMDQLIEENEKLKKCPLTGCLNRTYFENSYLWKSLKDFKIIFFDLDDLKETNDNFGHDCGDKLLAEFISNVDAAKRNDDNLVRWGGDEFLLLYLKSGNDEEDKKGISTLLRRVNKKLQNSFFELKDGNYLRASASIGIADDIKSADKKMYMNKIARKGLTKMKQQKKHARPVKRFFKQENNQTV